jgi:hypothetical protein
MRHLLLALFTLTTVFNACKTTNSMAGIQPTSGSIDLPASGELRLWKNIEHSSFSVTLSNNATKQSCELYTVNANGKEKWINPSLIAGTTLTVTIPKNGHLFFKNFNSNVLQISYSVKE